jgi:hypothetical protein
VANPAKSLGINRFIRAAALSRNFLGVPVAEVSRYLYIASKNRYNIAPLALGQGGRREKVDCLAGTLGVGFSDLTER